MTQTPSTSENPGFSEHAAQLLATEHWSLLASRSMAYNEAFSRVTVFLTVLSAAIVALALVANTSGIGETFRWFCVGLAPLVLFMGITTYVRLVEINLDDLLHVAAMNRLRRAYIDIAPELEKYLMTGWHDDMRGIFKTLLLARSKAPGPGPHFFITTPTVVAVVVASVAASMGALLADWIGASPPVAIGAFAVTLVVAVVSLFAHQFMIVRELRRLKALFPSDPTDYAEELGPTPEL